MKALSKRQVMSVSYIAPDASNIDQSSLATAEVRSSHGVNRAWLATFNNHTFWARCQPIGDHAAEAFNPNCERNLPPIHFSLAKCGGFSLNNHSIAIVVTATDEQCSAAGSSGNCTAVGGFLLAAMPQHVGDLTLIGVNSPARIQAQSCIRRRLSRARKR
ncbi:hypothetical protein [Sinorhizobium terangae]|uniref:Uncharacterized protein n=1 Tax=Sinorhizobium terangae TaxID=110322 RepID=A0A6N7LBL0_SINTE|nr:hypothetical protein [Sinorhizobium terangae]MBB4188572.1 hypothetical protein [Sinorhizobium terangae]MQX14618.1 hypothetical protein [Sinorhizobium terangae]WFU51537.1 hypothetical protein QA637_23550 [Sinorhizobium terangae]